MKKKRKFYIIYLAKDDSIVAVGSAEECAKQMGFKNVQTFYCVVGKTKKGILTRYEVVEESEGELE